jgi:DNA repair exonuclease SbcCD ATPase subunit
VPQVNATQRLEELLELKEELQAQLDAANKSLKEQEGKLKTAREEGEQLKGKLEQAEEAKSAAEKVSKGDKWCGSERVNMTPLGGGGCRSQLVRRASSGRANVLEQAEEAKSAAEKVSHTEAQPAGTTA